MTPKIYPRGKKWLVRYDEYVTVQQADGTLTRGRKERTKSFDTKREAEARAAAITVSHAKGEHFVEAQHRPVARLRDVALDYAASAKNPNTSRHRASMMNKLLGFTGDDATVAQLSRDLLRDYGAYVGAQGLKRVDRFVGEVETMWAWAHRRELAGVPLPRRIVGDELERSAPVFAVAAPSWADCDAMIRHLRGWHRRVATMLRYTGIRASQVLTLDRSDVNLDAGVLRLRANARGAKGIGRHRAVPIHAALKAELADWELPASGPIFLSNDVRRRSGPGIWREDALVEPFTRAWRLSEVDEAKWGAPEDDAAGRVHARPTHAFRSAFKSGLLRAEVPDAIANLLVGHSSGSTHAAYVPEGDPTASPYWRMMVDALAKVPRIAG